MTMKKMTLPIGIGIQVIECAIIMTKMTTKRKKKDDEGISTNKRKAIINSIDITPIWSRLYVEEIYDLLIPEKNIR